MLVNVAELVQDPELAQPFTIERYVGSFANEGEYSQTPTVLQRFGVIQPTKADDLIKYLPEGERQGNAISIYCKDDIFMADGNGQQSDVIIWQGDYHRVAFSKRWNMHGFWFAIATGFVHG